MRGEGGSRNNNPTIQQCYRLTAQYITRAIAGRVITNFENPAQTKAGGTVHFEFRAEQATQKRASAALPAAFREAVNAEGKRYLIDVPVSTTQPVRGLLRRQKAARTLKDGHHPTWEVTLPAPLAVPAPVVPAPVPAASSVQVISSSASGLVANSASDTPVLGRTATDSGMTLRDLPPRFAGLPVQVPVLVPAAVQPAVLLLEAQQCLEQMGSTLAVADAALSTVAHILASVDTFMGIGSQVRLLFSQLSVPVVPAGGSDMVDDSDILDGSERRSAISPLQSFASKALSITADAFASSDVVRPAGKRQHTVGSPAWSHRVQNALRIVFQKLLHAGNRAVLFEAAVAAGTASATDSVMIDGAPESLPVQHTFESLTANPSVLISSTLSLLIANACWASQAEAEFATATGLAGENADRQLCVAAASAASPSASAAAPAALGSVKVPATTVPVPVASRIEPTQDFLDGIVVGTLVMALYEDQNPPPLTHSIAQ